MSVVTFAKSTIGKKIILSHLATLIIVTIFSLLNFNFAYAFGVGPAYHTFNELVNGVRVPVNIVITRGNPATSEVASVSAEGIGAKYIEFPQATIQLPKGKDRVNYTFYVHPKNAANGDYDAKVLFAGGVETINVPGAAGSSGLAVRTGASISVKFSISDKQVKAFELKEVPAVRAEAGGGQQLPLIFSMMNTGNVDFRPDYIEVIITKPTDPTFEVKRRIEGSQVAAVEPNQDAEVSLKIPAELPVGDYMITAVFYVEGKEVTRRSGIPLNVLQPGSLQQRIDLEDLTINGASFKSGDLVKFDAKIKNSGQAAADATLLIELSKDGKVFDVLNGQRRFLAQGQQADVSVFFKPSTSGDYSARVYVDFQVGKSNEKSVQFSVETSALRMVLIIGIGVLLVVTVALIVSHFIKKKQLKY